MIGANGALVPAVTQFYASTFVCICSQCSSSFWSTCSLLPTGVTPHQSSKSAVENAICLFKLYRAADSGGGAVMPLGCTLPSAPSYYRWPALIKNQATLRVSAQSSTGKLKSSLYHRPGVLLRCHVSWQSHKCSWTVLQGLPAHLSSSFCRAASLPPYAKCCCEVWLPDSMATSVASTFSRRVCTSAHNTATSATRCVGPSGTRVYCWQQTCKVHQRARSP